MGAQNKLSICYKHWILFKDMAPFSIIVSCLLYSKSCNCIPLFPSSLFKRSQKKVNSLDYSIWLKFLLKIISPTFVSYLCFINSNLKFISRLFLEERLYIIGLSSNFYSTLPKIYPSIKIPLIVFEMLITNLEHILFILCSANFVCVYRWF